jgi:hypothetical protein
MRRAAGLVLVSVLVGADAGYVPPAGIVPDAVTATRVAEDLLVPVYGRAIIDKEKPLRATLDSGAWTVRGTLPAGRLGGVAVIKISKSDGRVLYMMHGK